MAECKQAKIDEPPSIADITDRNTQLKCSICLGFYKTPRYLPTCGHTYCENCLFTYARSVHQEIKGSTLNCPTCRRQCTLPDNDEVTVQLIRNFPLNTMLMKMMEALPQSNQSLKEEQTFCCPCNDEGEANLGFKFCTDCKEVLCKECTQCHRKFNVSKGHKLVDVSEMSREANVADLLIKISKCQIHSKRVVEFYCKTHNSVVCALCLLSHEHRECKLTEIVQESSDDLNFQSESELIITQMKSAVKHLSQIQNLQSEIKTNFKKKLKETRERAEQVRSRAIKLINSIVKHVVEATKRTEIEQEDKIDADISRIGNLKNQTEQKLALLSTVQQYGLEKHKIISAISMKKELEELVRQISKEDNEIVKPDMDLIITDSVKTFCETENMEDLVRIKMTERESNHTPFVSAWSEFEHTLAGVNHLRDGKLVKVRDDTVLAEFLYSPTYTGITVCKNGRIILCDNYRSWLCLYNPANTSVLKQKLSNEPYCATEMDNTNVAVSLPAIKAISIVLIDSHAMQVDRTLVTPYEPRSIVALKSGNMAVAWNDPMAFGMIDINGSDVVQTLYMDKDASGRKFKSFDYLAVDERRQHVLQPCTEDKAVYCFDYAGKPVFKCTYPGFENPKGVTLDSCGNIYICECSSKYGIHKLTPTGKPVASFTEGVPRSPLAIGYDGTGFWVTQCSAAWTDVAYFILEFPDAAP